MSRWQRFWFEPQETSTLALFRIAFGLLAVGWTVSLLPNLFAFYGPTGVLPDPPARGPGEWGLLAFTTTPAVLVAVAVTTLLAALGVTVGLFTRVCSILLWIGILSLEQRNPFVTNAGDGVLRDFAFLLALTPAGAALSVDRLLKAPDRFWGFPPRAPWGLRLIQIQVSVGYLAAVWHKAQSELWLNGTAVSYSLRIEDIHRFPTPTFVTESGALVALLTYGTLAVELSLGVLIWVRRLRPWVLALGASLHLGIDASIMVGFFSYLMLAGYLSFLPPEVASRAALKVRTAVSSLARTRPAPLRAAHTGMLGLHDHHHDGPAEHHGPDVLARRGRFVRLRGAAGHPDHRLHRDRPTLPTASR